VFSVPITVIPSIIREYTKLLAADRAHVPLWMDVTSLKAPAVAAFREAAPRIEAVGLHPMCAPPPVPSMAGRTLAVCEAGPLVRWGPWFEEFLNKVRSEFFFFFFLPKSQLGETRGCSEQCNTAIDMLVLLYGIVSHLFLKCTEAVAGCAVLVLFLSGTDAMVTKVVTVHLLPPPPPSFHTIRTRFNL
jgi:hypothetical protein